jgi:hypothetical protein
MPLTNGHAAFAALHERGLNTFIGHVYTTRRYYFHYAALPMGSGTPGVDFEVLPPIPVPVAGYGLAYSIDLSRPIIDFAPQNAGSSLPAPLTLGANQFSITVEDVRICVLCGFHVPLPDPDPRGNDRPKREKPQRDQRERPERVCTRLKVWAVGHPTVQTISSTDSMIGLEIDDIVVKEVCDLEPILECLAKEVVNALLDELKFRLTRIALGALPAGLVLGAGPEISNDQLKVWAEIV